MIIELYGSPGCGKSYFLTSVADKRMNSQSKNKIKQVVVLFLKKLVAYTPSSLVLKMKMMQILGKNNHTGKYFERPLKVYLNNICMLVFFYRILKKKKMYMDEGYIQRITAMSVNLDISIEKTCLMIELIKAKVPYVKPIYLYTEPETCFVSIRQRDRHQVDMDELNDNQLMEFLKQYETIFEYVSMQYHHKRIVRGDKLTLQEVSND